MTVFILSQALRGELHFEGLRGCPRRPRLGDRPKGPDVFLKKWDEIRNRLSRIKVAEAFRGMVADLPIAQELHDLRRGRVELSSGNLPAEKLPVLCTPGALHGARREGVPFLDCLLNNLRSDMFRAQG